MSSQELAKYKLALDPRVFLPAIGMWLVVSIVMTMKIAWRMKLNTGAALGAFAGLFFGGVVLWGLFSLTDMIPSSGLKGLAQLGLCVLVTLVLGALLVVFTM